MEKENEATFFVYADEFYFAAEQLEKSKNPGKVATASYYLYGHSLELAYKSFLFRNGLNLIQLKKIGHDLESSLQKCRELRIDKFIDIDHEYLNVVSGINKYYATKEFEYMSKTEKTFPHLCDVKLVVNRTINMSFTVITDHL